MCVCPTDVRLFRQRRSYFVQTLTDYCHCTALRHHLGFWEVSVKKSLKFNNQYF